jgi:hypothetical protein
LAAGVAVSDAIDRHLQSSSNGPGLPEEVPSMLEEPGRASDREMEQNHTLPGVILMGDFNCTPGSVLYHFLSEVSVPSMRQIK